MKKKFNILFTSDSVGVSGAEFVILDIMKNLNRDRFTPFVFCHANNRKLIERITELDIEYKTTSNFPGIDIIGKSGVQPSKILGYLFALIRISIELIQYLKSKKIDLIYANAYPNCLYYMISSFISMKPLAWHVHNIRSIHIINVLIYKLLGAVYSKIITVSNACKKNLLKAKIKPSKIVTIYNGMDLTRFNRDVDTEKVINELGIRQDAKVVGLFGQPIPEKGHRYFIEAAAKVIKVFKDAKFLIVGHVFKSKYQQELYDLIDYLDINENVVFTGWRNDIPDVMASIDVLAHTRITPEPAALVLMEAMAMGKPIVASNTGGTAELVNDQMTGFLVPPNNSEDLAKGIIKLLKNPEKAMQMGLDGRKRVEKYFTLEKQIKSIEKLLEEIIQKAE